MEIEPSAIRDVYVFVRRGDLLLLLLRDGTGYKDGEWGPPAGKVEVGGDLPRSRCSRAPGGDGSGRRPRSPEIGAPPASRPGPRRGVAVGGGLLRRERRARRPDEPGAGEMPSNGLASGRCAPEPDGGLRRTCAQGRRPGRGLLRVAIVTVPSSAIVDDPIALGTGTLKRSLPVRTPPGTTHRAQHPGVAIPWNEVRAGYWEARCVCGVRVTRA